MIEKYTFNLHFKRRDEKLIIVKSDSESRKHIILKLLSFMLFYDPRLEIEKDVGLHYKPDLVIPNPPHHPELWIDCGQIGIDKLDNLTRKLRVTRIVVVKSTAVEMRNFKRSADKKLEYPERVGYLAFEKGFVEKLEAVVQKKNDWTLYPASETAVAVATETEVLESDLTTENLVMAPETFSN